MIILYEIKLWNKMNKLKCVFFLLYHVTGYRKSIFFLLYLAAAVCQAKHLIFDMSFVLSEQFPTRVHHIIQMRCVSNWSGNSYFLRCVNPKRIKQVAYVPIYRDASLYIGTVDSKINAIFFAIVWIYSCKL